MAPKPDKPKVKSGHGSFDTIPRNALLSNYLSTEEQKSFVNAMAEVSIGKDEVIMREGENGNNFFILKAGECEVTQQKGHIRQVRPGDGFGELSVLTGNPRSATITTTTDVVTLLMCNKTSFKAKVGDKILERRGKYVEFLKTMEIISANTNSYGIDLIADACQEKSYPDRSEIMKEKAEPTGFFYIVKSGEVVSTEAEPKVYGPGDFFGESECLQKCPCLRTLRSKGQVVLLLLSSQAFTKYFPIHSFMAMGAQLDDAMEDEAAYLKQTGKRGGIAAEKISTVTLEKQVKSGETAARINEAVKEMPAFAQLDAQQRQELIDYMAEHHARSNEIVMRQGERGNHFYVVEAGTLEVTVEEEGGKKTFIKTVGAGGHFGELALMYSCPRTATVTAKTDCTLWSLDRATFRSIVLATNAGKAKLYDGFLKEVELLKVLNDKQRARLVDSLEPCTFKDGEVIVDEGVAGTHFYIIEEGLVKVMSKDQGELVRRMKGDYFGELSLKTGAPTIASVIAVCDSANPICKLVRVERGAFNRMLGPLEKIMSMRKYKADGTEMSPEEAKQAEVAEEENKKKGGSIPKPEVDKGPGDLQLSDFKVCKKVLGQGAFGKVQACIFTRPGQKSTGTLFALKQMGKSDIVKQGQVEHILQESQILDTLAHPFMTNKWGGFQTPSKLLMVMEFCPGGDMFDVLYKHKKFPLNQALVYHSQVLMALEHLHDQTIVHRDLKLENVLIAADGTAKLTDFGFAKPIEYRSWTLCGTPEYLAPELVLEKGHNKAVDYWALGIFTYELQVGHSPFVAEDAMAVYQKILKGKLDFPSDVDMDMRDLIANLLQKEITKRYGNLKDGTADIKNHKVFKNNKFDWSAVYTTKPKYVPPVYNPDKPGLVWDQGPKMVPEGRACSQADNAKFKAF